MLKEVSPLECHALVKFTLFAAVPSFAPAGNVVRAVQFCHEDVKSFPLLKSKAGNAVSPLSCHEKRKATLLALVPRLAPLGNSVREEVLYQA